jgi:two-component system CheB/CheR fusion protein
MAIHQIEALDGYVKLMQQTPTEVEALFRDLLIGVTRFFRDPEAFQVIEEQTIPQLFTGKPTEAVIRVWVPGCSTGEEAYSLAILLHEHMEALKQPFRVQVFATDIDSRAVAIARTGVYPAGIIADIAPERLTRFFSIEAQSNTYRIHKTIRDLLIFSEQDVIKDPPFSKIDLISCRNLLIYMGAELQKKLIHLFHYALNPGGFLLLGTSESVGDLGNLFVTIDRKLKIYQRKEDAQSEQRVLLNRLLPPTMAMNIHLPRTTEQRTTPPKPPLRDLAEQAILQQIAPAAALVNRSGDILYLHGRTGMYLEPTPGEAGINNILKMARDGLRHDLATALHKAAGNRERVRRPGLRVKTNGDYTTVNLTVSPVASGGANLLEEILLLVILEEAPPLDLEQIMKPTLPASTGEDGAETVDANTRIEALKQELRTKDEYLQTANEMLEASNEELKSSNEEMQSVNEELQSSNEELETSKEELQSINEELATVNSELQTKVVDLSRANNDMNNLLAGTGIGTVFVDHQLRILRFTPAATRIIKLIPSDVGRPVGDLAFNLVGYDQLVADTEEVLNTLAHKEVQVQTAEGKWYAMRIQPYRTLDNVIEGAVITFVDNTELKAAQEALLRLAVVVHDAHDAVTVHDLEGRILSWNPSATRLYGWSEAEALQRNIGDLIPEPLREEALTTVQQLSQAQILEPYRTKRIAKNGTIVAVRVTATALMNNAGQIYAIATTEREEGFTPDCAKETSS